MNVWATNGGIYLGCPADSPQGDWRGNAGVEHRYDGDRHILLLGPNGSGKTRRLLYPNLLSLQRWSVLVVDPKGLLAGLTINQRIGTKIVLDPFKVTSLPSAGFNPLSALNSADDTFPDDCLGIARSLIQIEGSEPHWSASAQDWVCALIMYEKLKHGDAATLVGVRKNLGGSQADTRQLAADMCVLGDEEDCGELVIKASRFLDINEESKELNSILSTALTQTRWLDSRPIKADLSGGTFDFATMKDRPVTVYLVLPPNRLVTHGPWLRLMITAVLQPLLREVKPSATPVLFMLDEFAQLGHLPVIEENLAVMREYGVKLWPVFQDVAQGQAIYGKRWPSFLSNSGIVQSFSAMDVDTAELLSKRSGQTSEWIEVPSESRNLGRELSRSVSAAAQVIQRPVLWPHDLMDMDDGYTVIYSHRAKGPVFAFAPWPSALG